MALINRLKPVTFIRLPSRTAAGTTERADYLTIGATIESSGLDVQLNADSNSRIDTLRLIVNKTILTDNLPDNVRDVRINGKVWRIISVDTAHSPNSVSVSVRS